MTGAQRVRQADLARQLGITRQSVHELVTRGVLEKGADGLIDVELARVAIANRVNPGSKTSRAITHPPTTKQGAAASTPPAESFAAAKTAREMAEARIAELKLREMTGQAVDAKAVERATFAKARIARDAVMAVAPRIYQQLAAESDPHRVLSLLRAELQRACAEIAAGEAEQTRQ